MHKERVGFDVSVFENIRELPGADAELLQRAMEVSGRAYAPYSGFRVGAAARMQNGEIITGTNQENASFPAGLCAERVLLSAATALFPGIPVTTIAISYQPADGDSNHPIAPCGICRQALQEEEGKNGQPIRLVLGGMTGKIFVIDTAAYLMPLGFTGSELS